MRRCRLALLLSVALYACSPWGAAAENTAETGNPHGSTANAASTAFGAPNPVVISSQLMTSGQPDAAQLARLKEAGFDAVIYLAPPTVGDAVRDEQLIVTRQGMLFINLPVNFSAPGDADFDNFAALLQGLLQHRRHVLVHCQVNFRASSFLFLYRSIVLKENPQQAQEALNQVWKPNNTWRKFIEAQLRRAGLTYELM